MTETATTPATAADAPITLALAALHLSDLNPRADAAPEGIAALAQSLRTLGQLQNLAGLREADGRIAIVAGGRRLRAFQHIAEEDGLDPAEVAVSVIVTEDRNEAVRWAGAENLVREELHPADEVRAYAAMGGDPEAIARAFGVTVRHVKGRLKLAKLPDAILDALRSNEITLDVAAAYTVSNDPERMLEVFEKARHLHYGQRPHEIRHQLTHTSVRAERGIGAFVGREAYEAAGGAVTEDLFGEEVWLDDVELAHRLAREKLETMAAEVGEEGWAWTEVGFEAPAYDAVAARVYPRQVEVTEEEAARYDELAELIEDGAADEAATAEFETLSARLDEEIYTAEQKNVAGAYVHVAWNGGVSVARGLVRASEVPAAIEAGVVVPSRHSGTRPTGTGATSASIGGEPAEKEKPLYSGALSADLARVRTAALQTALLAQPALVQDLVAFALTHDLYADALPLGLGKEAQANEVEGDEGLSVDARLRGEARVPAGAFATHLGAKEGAEAFARFRAQSKRKRQEALTAGMARLVGATLALEPNPFVEYLAREAAMDVRAVWRPTEGFFKRLTKAQCLAIFDHVVRSPEKLKRLDRQPKGDVADWLHLMFAESPDGPRLDEAQRARMLAWTPEGLGLAPEAGEPADAAEADEGDGDAAPDEGTPADEEAGPDATGEMAAMTAE